MRGEQDQFSPRDVINSSEHKVHVLPATSLREVWVENPLDKLCLTDQKFTLMKVADPDGDVYLGLLGYPFRGYPLLQFLNSISYSVPSVDRVLGDWEMPTMARELKHRKLIHWHEIHEEDPYIGQAYREFDSNHRTAWIEQLSDRRYGDAFFPLEGATFIDNKATFGLGVCQRFISRCKDVLDSNLSLESMEDISRSLSAYYYYRPNNPTLKMKISDPEEVKTFLEQRSETEQVDIGLYYYLYRARVLLDLGQQEVLRYGSTAHIGFIDHNTVVIHDRTGTEIHIKPGRQIAPGEYDRVVTQYTFPSSLLQKALYALLAWRKSSARGRSFLAQPEAEEVLAGVNSLSRKNTDVMLGRVLATYLSEEIRANLAREMELLHGTRPQRMMIAQVPVLVSLPILPGYHGQPDRPGPATQLLSDENPLFPKLEEYADRLAA